MTSFEKYPEYQATKYPWIGDLPNNWNVRRLKEVGRLFGGAGFPHEYQNVQGEELYFYKVGDLSLSENGKTLLASPHTISKETARVLRATIVPKSAIVYAKIGAALLLNRRRMTTAVCCIDNNMTAYVTEAEEVIPEWAFYWLSTIDFGEHVNPGAVPSFSEGYQSVLPIPVPPVEEQKVIAHFLDFKTAQIDALIAKKKALLDKLAEKRTALISHSVTKGLDPSVPMRDSKVKWLGSIPQSWKETRVKFLGELILGLTYSPDDVVSDGGTLVLRSSNVQEGKISLDDCVYVSCNIPKKVITKVDDILICSRNGSRALIGKCALLTEEVSNQAFGAFMTVLRSKHARFLYYVLNSTLFKFQSGRFLTSTINQLTMQTLGDFEIALPPEETQLNIVSYLDMATAVIDAQCSKAQSVIDRLTEYRSAMITNAVTGKIDVRGFAIPQLAKGVAS